MMNLLEQLTACEKVSFTKEPLAEFEDLEEKLKYKIVKAIESLMVKLHNEMSILRDVSKRISEYRRSSFQVYSQHAMQGRTLSLEETSQGSPTCPSIAELLEWLTDIDRAYSELHEEKLEILEHISYEDPLASQEVLRGWKSVIVKKKHQ
ncbi:hypothetical protein QZH41_009853, partial [Actinostola sp. cb2023]